MSKGITFFKPNPRNAGFLFSFNFGPAKSGGSLKGELALYVSSVAQASWNAQAKTGSFSANARNPQKSINVKLNEFEAGSIINAFRTLGDWKGFHAFPGSPDKVQLSVSPSIKENVIQGYFFSVTRNSTDKFTLALTLGECETLAMYLDFGLKTLFSNRFRAQVEYQNNQAQAPQVAAPVTASRPAAAARPAQPSRPPTPPPAPVETQEDNPFEQGEVVEEAPADEGDGNPFGS